ncbi:GGDEF domain-containing protein [Bordetella sp. FB-8]|uniref:GGDEF domain-containing protein n=1 Tax=Bordetella sp. FB-8 TaxID=1159870 RepID=UPI003510BD0E
MVMLAHDRLAERLERWANIDTMTGALVRRAFMERAQSRLERTGSGAGPASLAIIDIDHFKSINDRHGHAAGDQVLAHVGRLIGTNLQQDDLFGRIGGEEFGILLTDTGKQEALARIESLRRLIVGNKCRALSAEEGRIDVSCTFSAGVDEYRCGETLSNLMARADSALYAAKSRGRDCVVDAQMQSGC